MTTMVEAALPADQFVLNETLARHPSAEFEVLRLVANGLDQVMPFVWVTGDDLDAIVSTIQNDDSVEDVEVLAHLDDECLVRMGWMAHIRIVLYILLEEDAMILDASGKKGSWRFQILFSQHDSVSATHDFCREYGIDLEFERIYQLSESRRRAQYGLSEPQYETLVRAYEESYYHVPRQINLQELASRLDVSHQALSERMRRGHGTLIQNALRPEIETVTRS